MYRYSPDKMFDSLFRQEYADRDVEYFKIYVHVYICSSIQVEDPFQYEKRLLLRCTHHFKSDLINNIDHMRISGTEPSSVADPKPKK